MSTSLKSTGLAALAFSVSLGFVTLAVAPAVAHAAPSEFSVTAPDDEVGLSKSVAIGDLDLAQPRDMKRLEYRIRGASREVCAPLSIGRVTSQESECRAVAVRSAQPQVAFLRDRALRMAAAGQPSRIDTTLTVVSRDAE